MTFTIFDIVILSIITISSFFGLYKGAINIVINILGFIGSLIAAILAYPFVKPLLFHYISNDLLLSVVSGGLSYLISLAVFTLISSKAISWFNGNSSGSFDRFFGLIVGFIRGCFFALSIFTTIAIFSSGSYVEAEDSGDLITKIEVEKYPSWLTNSKTTHYLQEALIKLYKMMPEEWLKSIKMPKPQKEEIEGDIIGAINRKKDGVKSFVDKTLEGDLKVKIEELLPEVEKE